MLFVVLQFTFIILNNLYCIPTYLIWMLLIYPFKPLFPRFYDALEGTLYRWMFKMPSSWIWLGNVKVEEAGDSLDDCINQKCLLMCNHQSTSDVPLLMYFLSSKPNVASKTSWVMDIMFKYSHFGWISQFHHDFFIKQGRNTREKQLTNLKKFLMNDFSVLNRKWLILFPEGGFFYKRHASNQRLVLYVQIGICENEPINRSSSFPMVQQGSQSRMVVAANDIQEDNVNHVDEVLKIKWIIDLTICYPGGNALSLFDLIIRRSFLDDPLKILFLCRKYPVLEVDNMDSHQLKEWMYNKWTEKDEMLKLFYESGRAFFPTKIIKTDLIDQAATCTHSGENIANGIQQTDDNAVTIEMDKTRDLEDLKPLVMVQKFPQPVSLSPISLWAVHCFFIASTYFHYSAISYALSFLAKYSSSIF